MLPGRAVAASGAGGLRPAPDALAIAWSVAVPVRRRMVAPRPIAHRAAPLASRGIVAMFVLAGRRVMAPRAITRRTAVPALRFVLLRRQQSADEREAKRYSHKSFLIYHLEILFFCRVLFVFAPLSFQRGDISSFKKSLTHILSSSPASLYLFNRLTDDIFHHPLDAHCRDLRLSWASSSSVMHDI